MADKSPPRIVVLGSINMDLVARCASLPATGETITASSFSEIPGGKGANQAVAASRAGSQVAMIGRVGEDAFAGKLIAELEVDQIDVQSVISTPGNSGVAVITVAESDGENHIVVVPGANGCLEPSDVIRFQKTIEQADTLMLQLESPMQTVLQAIEIARKNDTRVILDPAPAQGHYPDALFQVDLICPNETEAARLSGQSIQDVNQFEKTSQLENLEQLESAARILHQRGAKAVAVTLGAGGTVLFDGETFTHAEAFPIQAVDTTASGDAFAGALATFWAEGSSLSEAVKFGNAAGALAASRAGAKPSLPTRNEIEAKYSS